MTAPLRVMITAAATGIGAATARAFADEGHRVHASDIDEEALSRLNDDYPDIVTTPVDVRDEGAIDTWFDDTIDNLDGLDILVNNAGIAGPTAAVDDMDFDGWRDCLAVCLNSQFLTCRRAVPVMKDQRSGCIINIASTAALRAALPHPLCGRQMGGDRPHQVACHRGRPLEHSRQCHLPRCGRGRSDGPGDCRRIAQRGP